MNKLQCLKCTHEWLPRTSENQPLSCPSCKSRTWNREGYMKCEVCNRHFLKIHIHHINGNHKDNHKENLLEICEDCHSIIHTGFHRENKFNYIRKSRIRSVYSPEAILKLKELRTRWNNFKKEKAI